MAHSFSLSAGALLSAARKQARLSQSDLAERANISQSVVSTYESNKRDPAIGTLERLIEATGHHLVISLERDATFRPGLPDTPLGRRLRQHRKAVLACAARRGATNVRVFGSVARGDDHDDSDIDLVVDVKPSMTLFGLGSLEHELAEILGTRVDLVTSESLRPRVRIAVEKDAVVL